MTCLGVAAKEFARFRVPLPALLDTALGRLRRQARYARLLNGAGRRAAAMQALLDQASACIDALARPEAVLMPVAAVPEGAGVRVAGHVTLEGTDLARDISRGGVMSAYLLTLNYDQGQAFARLDEDYAAHHVQSDLAGEVLFALGRHTFLAQRARSPAGARLRRIPVQADAGCGQRRHWDARKVQALLRVFDGVNPGVSVTDTGCFRPLHALLGLTIVSPGPAPQGLVSASSSIRP